MLSDESEGINTILKKYSEINFGIGIDYDDILCTKVGVGGNHNRDLFWISNGVNRSTVIGDQCKAPSHIGISKNVYDNLTDDAKYGTKKDSWGYETKVDMWTRGIFTYNGIMEYYYYTSWYWVVN